MTDQPETPPDQIDLDTPLYRMSADKKLSMRELLLYFTKHGRLRISDLHLKVGCPPTYRIDGALQKITGPPIDAPTVEALARSLLAEQEMADLKTNCSVDSSCFLDEMQFRLNVFHDSAGLCIAIRALEMDIPKVEEIGFPNLIWQDIVNRQQGLVLVTGITGAGKSTTIASMIDRIAETRPCRIITLEDPVEYRLTSKKAIISQREVGRDVPTFARGLRDCLREDPDVIFVGEMRDRESTSWTLTAAETGHLVFSTLHTRDARGTVTRLLDMYPSSRQDEIASQISLGLRCVLCQKLIPRADGKGRVVAMEILNNTYAVSNLIRMQKLEQIYTQIQTRTKDIPEERMVTMERSLATLVAEGKVAPLEAEKWADDSNAFLDEMKRLGQDITPPPINET